jgi:hypothetical protein
MQIGDRVLNSYQIFFIEVTANIDIAGQQCNTMRHRGESSNQHEPSFDKNGGTEVPPF